jgi:hypothetical protein
MQGLFLVMGSVPEFALHSAGQNAQIKRPFLTYAEWLQDVIFLEMRTLAPRITVMAITEIFDL